MSELSSNYEKQPLFEEGLINFNIYDEMKIIDQRRMEMQEARNQEFDILEEMQIVDQKREEMRELEIKMEENTAKRKERIKNEAIKKSLIEVEKETRRKYINELIEKEAEKFADRILKALKKLSYEEISSIAAGALSDDERFDKIVSIYIEDAVKKGEEYIEPIKVTREALNKVLRVAKNRIEIAHGEFSRVEPVKRMKI